MKKQQIETIRNAALSFREAIVACKSSEFNLWLMRDFPSGACTTTCDLLGLFFDEQGITGVEVAEGIYRSPERTHNWLEVDGLAVDITASQFPDHHLPVYVVNIEIWRNEFQHQFSSPWILPHFPELPGRDSQFNFDYQMICSRLVMPKTK
ncbi:hypothetical protein LOC68_25325 [Blastopirellula sp. JC732]|uniref:Uncharacterized protein n=1 Tax=Blastopirellula sediminis TaxID=2894196 RepID=A0A9X1MRW1_9BACT|nr:hypothetical protein [Blastopirellula sediminis]MCC9604969.1 hypothetical protein [Blastopirellula sediminis]MCC9631731.1 hypothetical protein [Blastopirellula sediminis]